MSLNHGETIKAHNFVLDNNTPRQIDGSTSNTNVMLSTTRAIGITSVTRTICMGVFAEGYTPSRSDLEAFPLQNNFEYDFSVLTSGQTRFLTLGSSHQKRGKTVIWMIVYDSPLSGTLQTDVSILELGKFGP
jgi:hypothetical protein